MARLFTGYFEDPFATEGWTTGGTPTLDTGQYYDGTQSCLCNALNDLVYHSETSVSEASWYTRVYVRVAARPGSGNCRISSIHVDTGAELWRLTITTSGGIQARTPAGVAIGSPSADISLDTWYVLETRTLRRAAGVEEIEARVYEGQSPSASFVNDSTDRGWGSGPGRLLLGTADVAATAYFDAAAINDTTGGSDNSWPGPVPAWEPQVDAPEKLRTVATPNRLA